MTTIRNFIGTVGLIPIILIVLGVLLFRRTHAWTLPLLVGVIWGGWNVLFAKREIQASVTVGDDVSITYNGA
jgi:hypothetical protein